MKNAGKLSVTFAALAIGIEASVACAVCQNHWIPAECGEGEYTSPGGRATAALRPYEMNGVRMGGFLVLTVVENQTIIVRADDVTGLLWLDSDQLLYSTEETYGEPALWVFNVRQSGKRTIAGPKRYTRTYDYFGLVGACTGSHVLIYFYSASFPRGDSSKMALRTAEHLYQINLDGTGFSRGTLDSTTLRANAECSR